LPKYLTKCSKKYLSMLTYNLVLLLYYFQQEHYERCPEFPNECPYCSKPFDDKMKVCEIALNHIIQSVLGDSCNIQYNIMEAWVVFIRFL